MKTNYIEQAIQKAQESGWKYEEDAPEEVMYKWKVFCDPNFWISLGKSLGWGVYTDGKRTFTIAKMGWLDEWHRFIDHLASNGDPETFFKEILSQK